MFSTVYQYNKRKEEEEEARKIAETTLATAPKEETTPLTIREIKERKRQKKIDAIEQELNKFNENTSIALDDELCAVMFFRGDVALATVFICEGSILDYMDNVVFFRWPGEDHQEEYSIKIKNSDKKEFVRLLEQYKTLFK